MKSKEINQKQHSIIDTNKSDRKTLSNHQPQDKAWMQFKIKDQNIRPRSYHIAVIHQNILYVHGGYDVDVGILSDFHKIQLQNTKDGFKWIEFDQSVKNYPGKLKSHTGVVYQNTLIIYGGQTNNNQNSNITFIYDFQKQSWDKVLPEQNIQLPKLDSHAAFIYNHNMYIFGGFCDLKATYSNKIYQFNIQKRKWSLFYSPTQQQNVPIPRSNLGLVCCNNEFWIFGGINEQNTLNDLWKFDMQKKNWQKVVAKSYIPEPRRSHSMVIYEDCFYVFGGLQDVTKQKNDICLYNPKDNSWKIIQNCSNLTYENSSKKQIQYDVKHIKQHRTEKKHNSKIIHSHSYKSSKHNQTQHHPLQQSRQHAKNILDQNKHKRFLQKKYSMLKEFDHPPEIGQQRKLSPTSQNMLKTLKVIGSQQQIKKPKNQEIIYDATNNFIFGKKPCARDAHVGLIHKDLMIVMGGDRHLMSFSDIYYFDLKCGQKSKGVNKM